MKNGFTMLELIFVIVIMGILAAVAIPKIVENKKVNDNKQFPITIFKQK